MVASNARAPGGPEGAGAPGGTARRKGDSKARPAGHDGIAASPSYDGAPGSANPMKLHHAILLSLACATVLRAQDGETRPEPQVVELKGRVTDTAGKPVPGAAVAFAPAEELTTRELLASPQARTDADGNWKLQWQVPTDPASSRANRTVLLVAADRHASLARNIALKPRKGAAGGGRGGKFVPPRGGSASMTMPEFELVQDQGTLVLLPAARLVGRVRSEDGAPLAGVEVVATDALDGTRFLSATSSNLRCSAMSGADGIFELDHVLDRAVSLRFRLDGHFEERVSPVAARTPLDVTLKRSGHISGRVLDKDGRGLGAAHLMVAYELATDGMPTEVAEDGSFRATVLRPGRWRATARVVRDDVVLQGQTEAMNGAAPNLEILCKGEAAEGGAKGGGKLSVRAVARGDGKPVAAFRALALWDEYSSQNPSYRDYRLRLMRDQATPAKDGTATVDGPATHESRLGMVQVLAEGFAPALLTEVEFKDLEEGTTREPVTVELVPMATVKGRVVDAKSGEPIAGAIVWARTQQDPNMGYYQEPEGDPSDAVRSAADGTFEVQQLGEGQWELHVRHPRRPRAQPLKLELGASEQKADVKLTMLPGATVKGRLADPESLRDYKVFLHRMADFQSGTSSYGRMFYGNQGGQQDDGSIVLGSDGSFEFNGVELGNYLLVLVQPARPRDGEALYLPLEPFRVRPEGIDRVFETRRDKPGSIRGTVRFPRSGVPFERVVAIAQRVNEDQPMFFSPFNIDYSGIRAFLDDEGRFTLPVGPGKYRLRLVDVATGICLHATDDPLVVDADQQVPLELAPVLHEVLLRVRKDGEAAEMAMIDRIELRVTPKPKDNAAGGAMMIMGGDNENYDTGIGIRVQPGEQDVLVVVPEGQVRCHARNNVVQIRVDNERWNQVALGKADFETSDKPEKLEVELKVGAPPEVPPANNAEKEQAEDGTVIEAQVLEIK